MISKEQWPRAYLRAELIERGFDGVGYVTLAQALAALYDPRKEKPRVIVFDLRAQTFKRNEVQTLAVCGIPVILLGGAVELNEEFVQAWPWAAVLKRPFTIGQVADMVERLGGKA